jgi:superfamily II DNA or RNA helicase
VELRPYQLEAVDAIRSALTVHRSTLLVLATGLGKTVTFGEVAKRVAARGKRSLVLAHRGELLEQAAVTLRRFGLSVGVEQAERRVDVAALPDVVVASVQTLQPKRLARFAPDTFRLVIVDEAHHATATSYRAVLDHFGDAKVLGVTATPDRGDGVGLKAVFESVAFTMDIREGIAGGWLAPLELRSVVVDELDLTAVIQRAGDFAVGDLERELTRDVVLHGIAAPLAELRAGRQTLVFTAGVAQAHALADLLGHYGVRAAAVDGAMTAGDRAALLARYRTGELEVVCNCALWTEGFDAPETSCIALARPTRSRALLTQMIGRGTRLYPEKAACLVLDFEPQRAGSIRLASPAEVLAGKELPDPLLARLLARSRVGTGELSALIEGARIELQQEALEQLAVQRRAREEQARQIREQGVAYAAPRLDLRTLLDATADNDVGCWRPDTKSRPATPAQLNTLRASGINAPDSITSAEATRLIGVLNERRARGLCTLKQARKLAALGLRDDVTFEDARVAFDAIANNRWKPPAWLYTDPRFTRDSAA